VVGVVVVVVVVVVVFVVVVVVVVVRSSESSTGRYIFWFTCMTAGYNLGLLGAGFLFLFFDDLKNQ
jgi:hypothetical protein